MLESVSVHDLANGIRRGDVVIDVRTPPEFAAGHVPTARLLPMHLVPEHLEDFRADSPVFVICEVGSRSWQVGRFLELNGIASRNVEGGTALWRQVGWPLETGLGDPGQEGR